MRNRWQNGGATIEEEAEEEELEDGGQYRALNTTLELELGKLFSENNQSSTIYLVTNLFPFVLSVPDTLTDKTRAKVSCRPTAPRNRIVRSMLFWCCWLL